MLAVSQYRSSAYTASIAHRALLIILIAMLILSPIAPTLGEKTVRVWGEASVPALAVMEMPNGTVLGVTGRIDVKVLYPGEGRVYVNTEPLSDIDMQASVRAAVLVASYYAKMNPLDFDFLVSIVADSPLIGGPSAGSALVAAVYSALTGIGLNSTVAATGMILPDGLIGPVGGVPHKVQAAIGNGYTTVLIPVGQSIYTETSYETVTVGGRTIIRPVTVTWNVTDLAMKLGGTAVEVSTAIDVIYRFTGDMPLRHELREPFLSFEELELSSREFLRFVNESAEIRANLQQKVDKLASPASKNNALGILQSSSNYSSKAIEMWNTGYYYSGLSFAFVSFYYAMSALYYVESQLSGDPHAYLLNVYNGLMSLYEEKRSSYESSVVGKSTYSLDELFILSEIYSRILDVNETLDMSYNDLVKGDYLSASYHLGYAFGRFRSLEYWFALLGLAQREEGPLVKGDKLASWLLSYSYSSASYVNAIRQVYGGISYDISKWYERLSQASSLLAIGDYPGTLALAMDVLVDVSTAMQYLFSLNLSTTSSILREHSRLILGNSDNPPVSARFYLMAGDAYYLQEDYESSLGFYERGLIILYASSMTGVRTVERDLLESPTNTTVAPELIDETKKPSETTGESGYTPPIEYSSLILYLTLAALIMVTLALFSKTVRRTR